MRTVADQSAPAALRYMTELFRQAEVGEAGKKKIFVIEDEQSIAITLAMILQRAGYDVSTFSDITSGLAAVDFETPDLVLCDVIFEGMSGIDFAEAIARDHPTIPVILLSGVAETSEVIQRARSRGFTAHIHSKPIYPGVLLSKIRLSLRA